MTLLELQRRMAGALMRPLSASDGIAAKTAEGKSMRAEAAEFIKPNERLSPVERLEIYSKGYWFRILDAFYDDFPGLRVVLGKRLFDRLATAYLTECPSQSFTLRNLGSRLEEWLRRNPQYAERKYDLALDMVRLEWADVVAFDGPSETVLGPEDLLDLTPELRMGLQPYVQLLDLRHPVDDLRIRVNATLEEHNASSNAVTTQKKRNILAQAGRLRPEPIFLAVHRIEYMVYYRRLDCDEFGLLAALRSGSTIGEAIDTAFASSTSPIEEIQARLQRWFAVWAELGWLCRPPQAAAA